MAPIPGSTGFENLPPELRTMILDQNQLRRRYEDEWDLHGYHFGHSIVQGRLAKDELDCKCDTSAVVGWAPCTGSTIPVTLSRVSRLVARESMQVLWHKNKWTFQFGKSIWLNKQRNHFNSKQDIPVIRPDDLLLGVLNSIGCG